MNLRRFVLRQVNRLVDIVKKAKEDRDQIKDFAIDLKNRIEVLETKAESAKTMLLDHEARITALEES